MNTRELLKEARAELAKAHDHLMELTAKLPMQYFGLVDGNIIQAEDCLIGKLDAYLAAPSESAMEMARETVDTIGREMLALGKEIDTSYGPMQPPEIQEDKAIPYLAALIEGLQRRVPSAMWNDIASSGDEKEKSMKYRKKPVVIEAFKWTGDIDQEEDPEWIIEAIERHEVWFRFTESPDPIVNRTRMVIKTLEGEMEANPGDFIIQGIAGEIYPCKPDIFEKTYEPVED